MKNLFLLIALFIGHTIIAQVEFEEGYYINNSGERVAVLIKNADWRTNPSEVTFKASLNKDVEVLSINEIAEFGIAGKIRYLRATVEIDKSATDLQNIGKDGSFNGEEETVFLRTLVDGRADLYEYQNEGNTHFFFRMDDSQIVPLIYKRYIPENSVVIAENKHFHQQLFNAFTCDQLVAGDFTDTDYNKRDLVKLFTAYNKCSGTDFTNFSASEKRSKFNLRIRPAVQFASMSMTKYIVYRNIQFDSKANFKLGLEAEYVLPYHRNKWAFIVEPTYHSYKSEAVFPGERNGDGRVMVDYKSIEVPFGVRHYFFLNEENRIFVNVTYTADFLLGKNNLDFHTNADTYEDTELETNTGTNFSLGAGFSRNKFSFEARYNLNRTVTGRHLALGSSYDSFALIFGYNFL